MSEPKLNIKEEEICRYALRLGRFHPRNRL